MDNCSSAIINNIVYIVLVYLFISVPIQLTSNEAFARNVEKEGTIIFKSDPDLVGDNYREKTNKTKNKMNGIFPKVNQIKDNKFLPLIGIVFIVVSGRELFINRYKKLEDKK